MGNTTSTLLHICRFMVLCTLMWMPVVSFAQNMGINRTGSAPDSSAMLDVSSTTQGMLIPRMTAAQRVAIVNPANALMVFQTNASRGIYVYDNIDGAWKHILDSTGVSQLIGAFGSPGLDSVLLADSNANGVSARNLGGLSIGKVGLSGLLDIEGDTLNDLTIKTSDNNASQGIAFQNTGGNYTWNLYRADAGSNDADFVFAGGDATTNIANLEERMRILNTGEVGIGTSAPASQLHVQGNMRVETHGVSNDNAFLVIDSVDGMNMARIGPGSGGNTNLYLYDATGTVVNRFMSGSTDSYINSAGDFGVGTSNPTVKMHVEGGDVLFRSETNGTTMFSIEKHSGTNNKVLEFGNFTGTKHMGLILRDTTNNPMVQISTGSALTYFDNNDNKFSFGSNTAVSDFNFIDSSSSNIVFRYAAEGTGNNDVRMRLDQRGSARWFYGYEASTGNFRISRGTWTNPIIVIDSASQNVGIKNTIPSVAFQVDGGSDVSLSGGGYFMTNDESGLNIAIDENEIMARNNGGESPLYMQSDGGDFSVHFGQAGTQFLVQDNGFVGIGESSPQGRLDVVDNAVIGNMTLGNQSDDQAASNHNGDGFLATPWLYTTGIQAHTERGANATAIIVGNDGNLSSNDEVSFMTNGAVRMVIESDGQVGIGPTVATNAMLTIEDDGGDLNSGIQLSTSGGDDWYMFQNTTYGLTFRDDAADRMTILANGNVGIGTTAPTQILHINGIGRSTSAVWVTTSDIRAKQNVQTIDSALNMVMQFRPVTFEWKPEYTVGKNGLKSNNYGFISQEVEKVLPEMVTTTKEEFGGEVYDDFKLLSQDALVPLLVRSIQEQQMQISELQAQIDALKLELAKVK